jgi:hypothetical protein
MEKSNDLIGNRIRDLPVCSIVPQPTTLPRDVGEVGMERIKKYVKLKRQKAMDWRER